MLSPDNTFVDGLRQKPLGKKKIQSWSEHNIEDVFTSDEVKRNYQRNKKLIDLTESPKELFLECLKAYADAPEGDRSKLLNYFIKNRLNELMKFNRRFLMPYTPLFHEIFREGSEAKNKETKGFSFERI